MKKFSMLILPFAMIGCGEFEADGDSVAVDDDTVQIQSAISQPDRCIKVRDKARTLTWLGAVTATCDNRDHGNGASELYANGGVWYSDVLNRAHEVHGAIGNTYLSGGAQFSSVGYPIADESNPRFGGGKYSPFQFGNILWKTGASSAHAVYGFIGTMYGNLFAEWGIMGWPTGQEVTLAGRRKQDFEAGKLNYTGAKGTWPTMTSTGNTSNRLEAELKPRVTAANIQVNGSSSTVTATARGFTPGRAAQLRLTNPASGTTALANGTVDPNGIVSFSAPVPVANIWRVGSPSIGIVTFWVFQDNANQAVLGKSTSAGNNFLGQF